MDTHLAEVEKYLDQFIDFSQKNTNSEIPFERAAYLLKLLDNPQNKIKVVHVAGTSGKGSTCYVTSHVLHHLGFKVGLTVSPHIIKLNERIQINNEMISSQNMLRYLQEIKPVLEKMKKEENSPSYFEVMIALSYYIFWKEKVDYAVIETGMGGRFDATNTVTNPNKIAVITKIGLDHVKYLGNTYAKVASEKAHIIHEGNTVFAIDQKKSAKMVIQERAEAVGSKLYFIDEVGNYSITDVDSTGITFDWKFQEAKLENVRVSLPGKFQALNTALALTAIYHLSKRDGFDFNSTLIKKTLLKAYIPGRFDYQTYRDATILLDGAHNDQKMEVFIQSLTKIYPNKKLHFLIAIKESKDVKSIIKHIVPVAKKITITTFKANKQGMKIEATDPKQIMNAIQSFGFTNCEIVDKPEEAIDKIIEETEEVIIVTGSFYLVSHLYNYIKSN